MRLLVLSLFLMSLQCNSNLLPKRPLTLSNGTNQTYTISATSHCSNNSIKLFDEGTYLLKIYKEFQSINNVVVPKYTYNKNNNDPYMCVSLAFIDESRLIFKNINDNTISNIKNPLLNTVAKACLQFSTFYLYEDINKDYIKYESRGYYTCNGNSGFIELNTGNTTSIKIAYSVSHPNICFTNIDGTNINSVFSQNFCFTFDPNTTFNLTYKDISGNESPVDSILTRLNQRQYYYNGNIVKTESLNNIKTW